CYTRFLDLQKAEAQAREAQIEAALEKIRGRSLAMHHSDELREVIGITHKTLGDLHVKHHTVSFQLFDFQNKSAVFWPGNNLQEAVPKVVLPYDEQLMNEDTCHRDLWLAMTIGKEMLNKVYSKAQKDRWFHYVFAHNDASVIEENARQFIKSAEVHTVCFFPEKHSGLFADTWDGSRYSDEDIGILKRIAKVFDQAYVRFLDLQKAEAQAKEAVQRTSVDRVRAEIASMRTTNDLERITPLIWNELTTLGVPFIRCGVFIMDELEEQIHTFLSTPEGKAIAAFQLPYTSSPFFDAIEEWRAKKIHITRWDTEGFATLADSLVKEGQIATREQYLNTVPKDGLYLHYIPFLQGILYVGNT
ncbi:MAG: hypothetical protein ACKOC0_05280, partial [Cytophagales bacterium]